MIDDPLSDFTDQDGDGLASVTITGLESVGSLRLWDGSEYVNVVVGDMISKAQLDNGDLVFEPAPDGNGLPYDSFTFSVNDDTGSVGTTSAAMTVNVTPVNDIPTLTSFTTVIDTTNEDTEVELTLAELKAQGDEADVDGTVVAFVIKSVSTGTLKIGTSAGAATAWCA